MSDDDSESNKYSHEQKVVAAVWVHERDFNGQTWKDITTNFAVRFNLAPPNRQTFLNWERKLFGSGRIGRPPMRLMHVPYVRASLVESPSLSLRERSKLLGLSRSTLLKIINEDLNMEFNVGDDGNKNKKHMPNGGGTWKKKTPDQSAIDKEEEDDDEYGF